MKLSIKGDVVGLKPETSNEAALLTWLNERFGYGTKKITAEINTFNFGDEMEMVFQFEEEAKPCVNIRSSGS